MSMSKKDWVAIADAISTLDTVDPDITPSVKKSVAQAIADAIEPNVKGSFSERTFVALSLYEG